MQDDFSDDKQRMKMLIGLIEDANKAYYVYDSPVMSDRQYDELCDELESLENKTNIVMSNSPLHRVQGKVLEGFEKVTHTRPMLSAQKTKDVGEIKRFIGSHAVVKSYKLDGCSIIVRYKDGAYKQAITRGNGDVGEDVTCNIRNCINIPMRIPAKGDIEVRGECVISWSDFEAMNKELNGAYSHPRNLASASVRCLDTDVSKQRNLRFVAFELVDRGMDVIESFEYLEELGFEVVEHTFLRDNKDDDGGFDPNDCPYPVDGVIYKYNSYAYGKSLGITAHHPLDMMALKWKDELFETYLKTILYDVGRTGILTPVAVFEPVTIDGSVVEKASLHNLSVMESILGRPYVGQKIWVYKANCIIPCVDSAEKIS